MQAPRTFLFQTGNRATGDSDVFDMYFFHLARGWHPTYCLSLLYEENTPGFAKVPLALKINGV